MHPDLTILPNLLATPFRFLWLPVSATAILADLHLGSNASLAQAGLFLPDTSLPPLHRAWDQLISRKPTHVIVAGDLFDSPNPAADALTLCSDLFSRLPPTCTVTITPGNHDPLDLPSLLEDLPVTVQPSVSLGALLISHGHELPPGLLPHHTWIVGHQHPAVTLSTNLQSAKMPCYALAQPPSKNAHATIILPAFSHAPLGSNLLTLGHWLLPIARPQNDHLRILGLIERPPPADPQVLDFGPLSLLALT